MSESYELLKSYIIDSVDPCVDPGEQAKKLREIEINFPKYKYHLEKLKKNSKNIKYLAVIFKAWNQIDGGKVISSFAFKPSKTLCSKFKEEQTKIDKELALFNFQRAENLLYIAKNDNFKKYTDRHRVVEKALGLLINQCDNNDLWQYLSPEPYKAYALIAKCYLFRSRLALPKGSSVPEKKLEALEKAWLWIKRTSYSENSNSHQTDNKNDIDHWDNKFSSESSDLKIKILLEMKKWQPTDNIPWFCDQFEWCIEYTNSDVKNPLHWILEDIANEIGYNTKDWLDLTTYKNAAIPVLYKAKIAFNKDKKDTFKNLLETTVKKELNIPFSNSIWDDTIDLIEKASNNNNMNGYWEQAAINAWEKCKIIEQKLQLSVQVRWYWARHRKLYDLAVKAAFKSDDISKVAKIADSQKSRPTIKLKNMESRLLSSVKSNKEQERFKKIMDIETCFAMGNYNIGLDLLQKTDIKNPVNDVELTNIPDKWGSVHFYIAENLCTYISVFTKNRCEKFQFKADMLWEKYVCWEKEKRIDKDAEDTFCNLCEELGKQFQDVFNWLNENDVSNILFIPHGFLHLVPLHAAKVKKENEENFLFTFMPSLYLPAWSLISNNTKPTVNNTGSLAFSNWYSVPEIFLENCWINSPDTTQNSANNVIETINKLNVPPKLIIIYSHGKEDVANPYQSGLLMCNSNLTHEIILKDIVPDRLKGSNIILTACETDLASGDMGPADEHLSLVNAFLTKNAKAVLGTLYECMEDKSLELVETIKANLDKNIYEILQKKQKEWLENDSSEIEDIAVYRVVGFPNSL